jgi:hypothetical protein
VSDLLLGTGAFKMLMAGEQAFADWLEAQGDMVVHLTHMSIASLLASAERMTDISHRRNWIERLTEEVPADFGPRLHGFDLAAAKQWSAVSAGLPQGVKLVQLDLLVVSVALAEGFDYVAAREPWHEQVSGLVQHDPWTSKTFRP